MFGPKTHCVVVVGAQWGDEGKGKIVDVLAERADLVVRYQGGANAGHTVHTAAGEFVLHQIPSGIIQGAVCVVGNGVALDPETLFTELDALAERGVRTEHKLFVSDRAHLTFPYHKLLDRAREERERIGTTGRGIGPTYEDKYGRRGIRVGDLRNLDRARELVCRRVQAANEFLGLLGFSERADAAEHVALLERLAPRLLPLAVDAGRVVWEARRWGRGSAPRRSTLCSAWSKRTRPASATAPCPLKPSRRSPSASGSWAASSAPRRAGRDAAAGSTPWWCATRSASTASRASPSPSWTCSTRSRRFPCASAIGSTASRSTRCRPRWSGWRA